MKGVFVLNFIIKKFEELDTKELYNILKIRNEVFVVEQNCAYQDCDGLDYKAYHMYLQDEEGIYAYIRIFDKDIIYDDYACFGRVLVTKRHRGKQLGRELVFRAVEFIKDELKINNIKIEAQEYLTKFYESFGFEIKSEVYLEDDIPHINMVASFDKEK